MLSLSPASLLLLLWQQARGRNCVHITVGLWKYQQLLAAHSQVCFSPQGGQRGGFCYFFHHEPNLCPCVADLNWNTRQKWVRLGWCWDVRRKKGHSKQIHSFPWSQEIHWAYWFTLNFRKRGLCVQGSLSIRLPLQEVPFVKGVKGTAYSAFTRTYTPLNKILWPKNSKRYKNFWKNFQIKLQVISTWPCSSNQVITGL